MEMTQTLDQASIDAPCLACNLVGREFAERTEAITRDLFAHVDRVEELEDGFGFRFPAAEPWAAKALAFIAAEKECCPFFTFELIFAPDDGPLWLRLRGSEAIKAFVLTELDGIAPVAAGQPLAATPERPLAEPERNKSVVRRLVAEVFNGGHLDAINDVYTPELASEATEWIAPFLASFSDVRMEVVELIAERETVAARFTCSATQTGTWLGYAPTGRRFEAVDEVSIFRFRDGRISDAWGIEDNLGRLRQLGLA